MQKLHPKSLKIDEKLSVFQWFAILAFKKANIEKSFKNLDRSDNNQGFTKREHAKKKQKDMQQKVCNTCFVIAYPKYPYI